MILYIWYAVVAVILIRKFSPEIYDMIIVKMTSKWYKTVLQRLPEGARVLDIGIGTGSALAENATLVQQKDLRIVGVDYDQAYVTKCEQVIRDTSGLIGRTCVVCKSVYDADLLSVANSAASADDANELFDAVYFSGSISLMPDPAEALRSTGQLLQPNGRLYITQTFQRKGTKFMEIFKPLLKYFTTIDFGKLTYEKDVTKFCDDSGLETVEKSIIPGSVDNYFQAAFIIVLKKRK
jgi:ubiquinone/menaquinone biosynthesis C-methylase UbiE